MEKRRNCFSRIFSLSLTSGLKLHIHLWNLVVRFIFPQFYKSDISMYGYLRGSIGLRDNESRLKHNLTYHWGSAGGFLLLWYSSGAVWHPRDLQASPYVVSVESSSLPHYKLYLSYICPLWFMNVWKSTRTEQMDALFVYIFFYRSGSWGRGLESYASWSPPVIY